jgi:hypothetical protein
MTLLLAAYHSNSRSDDKKHSTSVKTWTLTGTDCQTCPPDPPRQSLCAPLTVFILATTRSLYDKATRDTQASAPGPQSTAKVGLADARGGSDNYDTATRRPEVVLYFCIVLSKNVKAFMDNARSLLVLYAGLGSCWVLPFRRKGLIGWCPSDSRYVLFIRNGFVIDTAANTLRKRHTVNKIGMCVQFTQGWISLYWVLLFRSQKFVNA